MKKLPCFVILTFLSFLGCKESSKSPLELSLDNLLQIENGNRPGYAVGITKKGETIYSKGFGLSSLEYKVPITTDTKFAVGSVSKQFTAACIAILIRTGQVDMEDDIKKYVSDLPDFPHTIKVKHLVYHQSGLWDYMGLIPMMGKEIEVDYDNGSLKREIVLRQKELNFTPGEKFSYSNTNYLLLVEIIESVSGLSIDEFAKENLFKPIGMDSTYFYFNSSMVAINKATGYYMEENNHYKKLYHIQQDVGAVNLITTLKDLLKWDIFLRSKSNTALKEILFSKGVLTNGDTIRYSFGLQTSKYRGNMNVGHNGHQLGFSTKFQYYPDQDVSIIILANQHNPSDIHKAVTNLVLGLDPENKIDEELKNPVVNLSNEYLTKFVGDYYCEVLVTYYHINIQNSQLNITINDKIDKPIKLEAVDSLKFLAQYEYIPPIPIPISFELSPSKKSIVGFEIISSRDKGLVFKKMIATNKN